MESFVAGSPLRGLMEFIWNCLTKYGKMVSVTVDGGVLLPDPSDFAAMLLAGKISLVLTYNLVTVIQLL